MKSSECPLWAKARSVTAASRATASAAMPSPFASEPPVEIAPRPITAVAFEAIAAGAKVTVIDGAGKKAEGELHLKAPYDAEMNRLKG